ncbi:hypothetical protein L211DRAFT_854476 [Terfezia boudieri ATCC MYA-4762]|uniref:Uncharacterized protein n=1 Tax=Terfezia boudieri ATCC MYA-4762 TaxID=1051890 RepID=A0A3N4L5D8_9PEZI|nr:hypothetical protein L211DRAFT_854476 [Terfezia boudieri ATCC MYA-4762]
MFVYKKAHILYKWYELSDEQKRFYLDLEEQEELPDFQIPKAELEVIQDNQTMELAEGGANDCLSNEDVGADIEEYYDNKPNKQDDDEDTGAWHKRVASESSSEEEEEEVQLTESDSNERRAKKLVKAKIIEALLSSDIEDDDYRDSTEEDDGKVNE